MEVALLAAGLNTLLPRIWQGRSENNNKKDAIDDNIEAIRTESNRLEDALEDAKFKGDGSYRATVLKKQARVLSQQAWDCIQRFFQDKDSSCKKFAKKTKRYSKDLKDLCSTIEGYSPRDKRASEKPPDPYGAADPMVMAEPMKELMDLVKLPDTTRKVISIVGFPGLGKTLLAKLVYDNTDCPLRSRVTAAAKDTEVVLREILRDVVPGGNHENLNLEMLGNVLADTLRGNMYLIVIDDIQSTEQWEGMKNVFPMDGDGTIIVTTTSQPVANVCSASNGYVYKLSPLDDDKSLDLFLNGTSWDRHLIQNNASDILEICDGLPLAIVSMSQFLQGRDVPTSRACKAALKQVGANLENDGPHLKRLRWVLMNKYTGLTSDALKSCLLYISLYKHNINAVPRRNSLIRRWEAEGFLAVKYGNSKPTEVAAENLKTLVDCNIIQSMEVGTNGSTRRFRPPRMMVEYISQISMSENFAALLSDAVTSGIRRLSFHPGNARDDKKISGMKLKDVLTLAVSGIGCEAILDFGKYELLGVLDLKECTNLTKDHVKFICKLLLLKYLSLGETIEEIPSEMENLQLLETLEMRTNKAVVVSAEVLNLPNLKHLIGMFELKHKPDKAVESGLETVTGFVSERVAGGFPFPQLMQHMKMLRKVKIYYCAPTASERDQADLQGEIKAFTSKTMNDHSLSIDFAELTGQIITSPLEFLQADGSLGSLKLRGDWRTFFQDDWHTAIPDFTKISGIKKICLSRTFLGGDFILASLTNLIALEYLKLEEQDLGPLVIKSGIFQNLTRLCLVGEKSLHGITIEDEALPNLVSLHLICKHLHRGIESSIGNGRVKRLAEIALDFEVHKEHIQGAWKKAAMDHPNRPQVLLIKKGAPIRQA